MDISLALEKNRNKKSINKDFYQALNFETNSMIMPVSDISNVVNTYKIFEDERNSCTKYRINLTLNPIMSNVLTNKITEITDVNGNILSGETRLNAIQKIDDSIYRYKIGYDIFDNHYQRVNTFKTGNTLNNFTGSTIFDLLTIRESIKDNITEDNGWVCITNKTKINGVKMFQNKNPYEKIDLFPTRDYFLFKPFNNNGDIINNWDYIITYPYENYTGSNIVTNQTNGLNGIPIANAIIEEYNGLKYLTITTPYKHGLLTNDIIKIKNENPLFDRTYLIFDVGDINKNNSDYKFTIDINKYEELENISSITEKRICKVINNIDSEYYIRKFRKLPNFTDDTDTITEENIDNKILTADNNFSRDEYQPGFSNNIFNDPIYQIQYLDDMDINLIKDNRGRPLSQLYLTIIKKNIIDGNYEPANTFTELMSGIDSLTGITGYSNIRLINGYTMTETPLEKKITNTGSTLGNSGMTNCFLGDIVEYNISTVKENKLDDIHYRFNTIKRETQGEKFTYHYITGDTNYYGQITGKTWFSTLSQPLDAYKEGYYYKPHYQIQLNNYSSIISQGEMPELENCSNFISGLTFDNQIVLLDDQDDNNIKNLILKMEDLTGFKNGDNIRITNNNKKYINTKISIYSNLKNCILITYNKAFMPGVSGLTIDDYTIRKYSNQSIPLYSQDQYNGICLWRDTLNEGSFDEDSIKTNESIFTNGRLYISKNFNVYLKRQDPFGYYGLKSNSFPEDISGNNIHDKIINYTFKDSNQLC